jgi:hypothetical protein
MSPVERTTLATRSMKGSGATIGILYPGYRGMQVMTQPHNPGWDTPKLPAAAPRGFQYWVAGRSTLHQISTPGGLHIP